MRLILAALALLTLGASDGNGYVRTRVETFRINDPEARCLYWRPGTIAWTQSTPGTQDLPEDVAFSAIQRSFSRWQTVMEGCGNIALAEAGRSARRTIGYDPEAADNLNLVIFRDRDCDDVAPPTDFCWTAGTCGNRRDCWSYSSDVLALTTSTYDVKSGEIYDSDIELNSANHDYTVSDVPCTRTGERECVCAPGTACVQTDIENTMTHEIGHVVGLAHAPISNSTMFATAPIGETRKREIDSASAEFICDAYPKGAPPKNCILLPASSQLGPPPQSCGGFPLLGVSALSVAALRRRRRDMP